ncbi:MULTISPECIES: DUF4084 domain-containing protein [Paraliobacillus]|uniref:DUF4084 domain-containing protein n=1 Tax=Paraliobacillus TaxID=200903 RepID=UPI000DD33782|nr:MULTISPECIES: DUF4084 domain-containing protein [Paraliobacillus]
MNIRKKKQLSILFIFIYTGLYYIFLITWKSNEGVLSLVGNFLSLFGCFIAAIWLYTATKESEKTERNFWLLLLLGTSSTFIAEFFWHFYENILKIDVPFPGLPDLFYLLQIVFYFVAITYKLSGTKRKYHFTKFIFDLVIVMTVASTFSWHFLIHPTIAAGDVSLFPLVVSLAYPIGDLVLLAGIISVYFQNQLVKENKLLYLLFIGLLIQIFADSYFLYLISIDGYSSGSLIDPLFILAILFVGLTGVFKKTETTLNQTDERAIHKTGVFRLILPYLTVTFLFVFMIYRNTNTDIVTIGSAISILLVMIRQIFIVSENQQLLQQLHKKKEQLEIGKKRYKSLYEYHPDAVYSLDLKGRFESVNSACAKLLASDKEELIGISSSNFILEKDHKKAYAHMEVVMRGQAQNYEISLRDSVGQTYIANITNIPILVRGKLVGIYGIAKDITENKQNEEKIQFLAYHDALTGLANRRLLEDSLVSATTQNEPFAIMFIDLDNFKKINDTLGHDVGDKLLVSISEKLRKCVNKDTLVARNGGDEFTILLKGISNREEVSQIANDLINTLIQPHVINDDNVLSSPSIGIALYPFDDTNPSGLMNKADLAMYQVKSEGKGKYKFYVEK